MDVSALLHRRREVAPDSSQLLLYSKGFYSSNSPPRPAFASRKNTSSGQLQSTVTIASSYWMVLGRDTSPRRSKIAVELILPSERSRLSMATNR